LESTLEKISKEYNKKMTAADQTSYGLEQGFISFSHYLQQGLFKIRKRLGTERYGKLKNKQNAALVHQQNGQLHYHLDWLKLLVSEYYDPMYQYQLELKTERVIFRGNNVQCLAFLQR
jgi:tRNA 2-selenouridine synthase